MGDEAKYQAATLPSEHRNRAATCRLGSETESGVCRIAQKVAEEDVIAERILFAEQGQIGKSVALGKDILRAALMRKQDAITLATAERVYRKSNSGLDVTPFDGGDWDAVKTELSAIGWGQS